jgi:hypothetical protein
MKVSEINIGQVWPYRPFITRRSRIPPEQKIWAPHGSKHPMARFPYMIGVAVVCLGVSGIQAQTARPVSPVPRSVPFHNGAQSPAQPTTAANAPVPTASGDVAQTQRPSNITVGPAVAPVVTYRDGLLTVQATNSTLGSVLTAIRNKTGIEFEGTENVSERVVLSLGPAPEGEVLSAIFAGPKYDFVAIGRPDSPGTVQRVMVTMKNKGGAESPQQPRPAGQEADEEDTPDEQVNSGNDPQDTSAQPPATAQQAPQGQQQPKSPEQLLQELQEMQKQKGNPGDQNQNTNQAPRKQPQP